PAVAGHRRGAARHHPGAGAYRAAGLGAAGVAVAGAAGAAVDPRTGSAAAMACMAACAARPRDAPSLNSIWQWNGPRPGCRGPGSALREGARPVPDAAGMLHPARPLPVAGRSAAGVLALVHPRADALPLAFHPAQKFAHHAQVQLLAEMDVFHAGIDRRVVVDLDHHRLVADLLQVHAVEAVADRAGGLQR